VRRQDDDGPLCWIDCDVRMVQRDDQNRAPTLNEPASQCVHGKQCAELAAAGVCEVEDWETSAPDVLSALGCK
jgi:hypothetical protein